MFITIRPQKITPGQSKSVAQHVDYLEKENTDRQVQDREYFFNQTTDKISREEVIKEIDANTADLSATAPRYYMITVSPSQRELQHIKNDPEKLMAYTRIIMKDYVGSFNREIAGRPIRISDIKYYAKIEYSRTFKGRDKEVRENAPYKRKIAHLKKELCKIEGGKSKGTGKKIYQEIQALQREAPHKIAGKMIDWGTPKPGPQAHLHLILSRRDQTNSASLSPGSKYKASDIILHGRTIKRGFNRDLFFSNAEKTFDRQFKYKRNFAEYYDCRKIHRKTPQKIYTLLLKLPTNERKIAMEHLKLNRIAVAAIPDAKIKFAIRLVQKAIELGSKSSAINY